MADTCSSVTPRPRNFSSHDTSCEPTAEEKASREIEVQREAERAAEIRRHAYFSSGTDEGGRCARAASDASTYAPMSPDDPKLKASLRTKQLDLPLQEDVFGNMLISALAGGLLAGLGRAAAGATGREVIAHAAKDAAKGLVSDTALHALGKSFDTGPELAPSPAPASATASPAALAAPAAPAAPAPAGRSSPRGTSEVAPEPSMSVAPPVAGLSGPYVIAG